MYNVGRKKRAFWGSGNKSQTGEQSHCKQKAEPQTPARGTHEPTRAEAVQSRQGTKSTCPW